MRDNTAPRRPGRRLAIASVVCGALALLLSPPFGSPLLGKAIGSVFGAAGLWLGPLVGLAAIGTAVGAFIRLGRGTPGYFSLAVLGMVAGVLPVVFLVFGLLVSINGISD